MTLFLECEPDETLAIALGVPCRVIVHSHGKGGVSKGLKKHSGVMALVDEDPGSAEPASFSKFVEISTSHDVRLRMDNDQNNRLIVICPRLEPWLIKTTKEAKLKMDRFNLSEKLQDLDADINHRLPNLERLLAELLNLRSPRLLHLKSLLAS